MLDLNLNVESGESTHRDSDHKQYYHYNNTEGSGTSNSSSIVNADASSSNDDSCSTRAPHTPPHTIHTFNFDILKVGGGNERENDGLVVAPTKELFPGASRSWMDLPFQRRQAEGDGEVRMMQAPSQQVKKSRRGPRSRSSQYRGVTFYRRTGRWESHIW